MVNIVIKGEEISINTMEEFGSYFVLVEKEYVDDLEENKIPYQTITDEGKDTYLCKRGVKNKKFNEEQQVQIKKDLESMSIRKVAEKYKCSPTVIQNIKNNKY